MSDLTTACLSAGWIDGLGLKLALRIGPGAMKAWTRAALPEAWNWLVIGVRHCHSDLIWNHAVILPVPLHDPARPHKPSPESSTLSIGF